MAGSLPIRAAREWRPIHQAVVGIDLVRLVPVIVLVVLFKLAVGDGGRDLETLTLAQTVVFVLALLLLTTRASRQTVWPRPLLGMVCAVAVTALWSVHSEASVRELLLWMTYLGIATLVAAGLTSVRTARHFVDGTVVIAGWLCLVALFIFWGADNPGMRWYSTFYWPNPFAAFLLLLLPIEVSRYLHASQRRDALAHGASALLLAVAAALTYSRGTWLSLVAIVPLALTALRPPSWGIALRRSAVLAIVVTAVALLLTQGVAPAVSPQGLVGRAASVTDFADVSIQGRLNFWRSGINIFLDHPLLGTGPGTFGAVHAAYQRDVRFYAKDAHNLYIQTGAEMGVLGLGALAMLLASVAALWLRVLQQARGTEAYPLMVGIGLGLAAFFFHSALDMDWMFPANPAMAFALIGALVGYERAGGEPAVLRRAAPPVAWRRVGVGVVMAAMVASQVLQIGQRHFLAGQGPALRGEWPVAAEQYAQAARWNPLNARYLSAQAAAVVQMTPPRIDAAAVALRRAMVLDRMNASHLFDLAKLLMDKPGTTSGDLAEAETLLRQAQALDPWNRPDIYRALARLYLRQGRTREADRIYDEAIARYLGRGLGGDSIIYALLWPEVIGLAQDASEEASRRGDIDRAVRILEAVLVDDPRAVPAALRLSELYRMTGRIVDARTLLEKTAAQVPSNAEIQAALKTLK